jgi:hypothetical protein
MRERDEGSRKNSYSKLNDRRKISVGPGLLGPPPNQNKLKDNSLAEVEVVVEAFFRRCSQLSKKSSLTKGLCPVIHMQVINIIHG